MSYRVPLLPLPAALPAGRQVDSLHDPCTEIWRWRRRKQPQCPECHLPSPEEAWGKEVWGARVGVVGGGERGKETLPRLRACTTNADANHATVRSTYIRADDRDGAATGLLTFQHNGAERHGHCCLVDVHVHLVPDGVSGQKVHPTVPIHCGETGRGINEDDV